MSRIVGLFHRDDRPAEAKVLQRLIAPMRRKANDGPRIWHSGTAGLAYQCLQSVSELNGLQPAIFPSHLGICFDGRLDNREELLEQLAGELPDKGNELPDPVLVLFCYRRFGESFASRLDGDFSLVLFDGEKRKMILAKDGIGVRPLYFWSSPRTLVAASEVKAILAHPEVKALPNEVAIADQLVGGDPTALRLTCFKGVFRLAPGHTVVVTPETLREFQHCRFDPTRQTRLATIEEYAEALRAVFEQAVRRRLRGQERAAVLVSGGLDSSAILCQAEVLRQRSNTSATPFGFSMIFADGTPADEKRYLDDIEANYRLKICRFPFPAFRYLSDKTWVWETEYPRMLLHAEPECLRAAAELGCSVALDGYYGDQMMSSDVNLLELARALRWLEMRRQFRNLTRSLTDCTPRELRQGLLHLFLREMLPQRLMRPLRNLRRIQNPRALPLWYSQPLRDLAHQRSLKQRRPAGPFANKHAELCYRFFAQTCFLNVVEETNKLSAMYGLERAHPFMDRDLAALVMSIPAKVVSCNGVYKGLFREAMRGILPESIRQRCWKADFTSLGSDAAVMAWQQFEQVLHPGCLAVQFGFVDAARLREALSRHRSQLDGIQNIPVMRLNTLVGLELWLQAFFGSQSDIYSPLSTVPESATYGPK